MTKKTREKISEAGYGTHTEGCSVDCLIGSAAARLDWNDKNSDDYVSDEEIIQDIECDLPYLEEAVKLYKKVLKRWEKNH